MKTLREQLTDHAITVILIIAILLITGGAA